MSKPLYLCMALVMLLGACSSASEGSDNAASDDPPPTATVASPPLAIPTTSGETPTPTPFAASDDSDSDDADQDGDADDAADAGDGEATSTPVPTATPGPIPTATPIATATPVPTAIVVSPTPTPVVPQVTPTPTPVWVNPDCYVGPGAADEPVWWCGGTICVVGAPHYGCPDGPPPSVGYVRIGCTISDDNIQVDEIITLQATQDPADVPITYSFAHGDGTIDRTARSRAFYEQPGQYDVVLFWEYLAESGNLFCGTVTVTAAGSPTPTPTPSPVATPAAVDISCSISKASVQVNEILTFTANQNPSTVPVSYVFDHGDGTLDATSQSQAYYVAPGYYTVTLQWAHSGTNGTVPCGTVEVLPVINPALYVGQTAAVGEANAASQGLIWRVVRIDDETFPGTTDYRIDRLNVEIDNGIITKVSLG